MNQTRRVDHLGDLCQSSVLFRQLTSENAC